MIDLEAAILAFQARSDQSPKKKSKPLCPVGLCPPCLKSVLGERRRGPLSRTRAYRHPFFLRHHHYFMHSSSKILWTFRVETCKFIVDAHHRLGKRVKDDDAPVRWPSTGTTMSCSGPPDACTMGITPAAYHRNHDNPSAKFFFFFLLLSIAKKRADPHHKLHDVDAEMLVHHRVYSDACLAKQLQNARIRRIHHKLYVFLHPVHDQPVTQGRESGRIAAYRDLKRVCELF